MFKKIAEIRHLIKYVLEKRNYFILSACTGLIVFIIFYFLTLATTADSSLFIFIMMNGFWYSASTFFLLAVIAVLFGIYLSLLVFKIKSSCKGKGILAGIFGSSGLIAGLFGAGCPMCGAALFALFGAPLALFFLPFKGLELRVSSLLLLSLSVYLLSRNLIKCGVKNDK